MPDYEKIVREAGWIKCSPESQWSWEKHEGCSVRGHFKASLGDGIPAKMSAKELCEKENLSG
jgi:hypothetical protein